MTGPAAPHGTASTRPPPASGMRTGLIAGSAVLVVAVIFIIQNAHSAGALLMAAAGPARVTHLRQILRRARREARAGQAAHDQSPAGGPAPADDTRKG